MDVTVTTFISPFSFFCVADSESDRDKDLLKSTNDSSADFSIRARKSDMSDFNHGQYVAVIWKNKWVRGIVTMESQFLIWLVDYGIYLQPNDKMVYKELQPVYKTIATKVFEASIHGVCPVDTVLTTDLQIAHEPTTQWTEGAIKKAATLLENATRKYFVPIAILTTKHNDVVLGDLYLHLEKGIVNFVDELAMWPIFLEKNKDSYVKNLATYYTSRRLHRASLMKPNLSCTSVPNLNIEKVSLEAYTTICEGAGAAPSDESTECDDRSEDGITVVSCLPLNDYKLSPEEIEKYSREFLTVHDREYNVLNILINKLRDLKMCEKYKDHDQKGLGRASYKSRN